MVQIEAMNVANECRSPSLRGPNSPLSRNAGDLLSAVIHRLRIKFSFAHTGGVWLYHHSQEWRRGEFSSRDQSDCGTLSSGLVPVKRKRMQVFYSGRVQGVGFRYSVRKVANGFEVTGSVRNLTDGRVELVAEGNQDELDAFRQGIRESGLEHFIQNEEVSWGEAKNDFRGFEIVA
jgi:acylphosphatase